MPQVVLSTTRETADARTFDGRVVGLRHVRERDASCRLSSQARRHLSLLARRSHNLRWWNPTARNALTGLGIPQALADRKHRARRQPVTKESHHGTHHL